MKIEWLYEAQAEYRAVLRYYRENVGLPYARRFADRVLEEVGSLSSFPLVGVNKDGTLLAKRGFRALFISNYAVIYRIDEDAVRIFHFVDARTNYIYNLFGLNAPSDDSDDD